jgi:DNA-binding MarR family transcriptional regulator
MRSTRVPAAENLDELASQLRFAVARLARVLRRDAGSDVTPSQLSALASILRDGPVAPSRLAEIEGVSAPTTTRIVASLEASGLVARGRRPDDRRSVQLECTPAGRDLIEGLRRRKDAYLHERLAALDPADRATLARAADLLVELSEP